MHKLYTLCRGNGANNKLCYSVLKSNLYLICAFHAFALLTLTCCTGVKARSQGSCCLSSTSFMNHFQEKCCGIVNNPRMKEDLQFLQNMKIYMEIQVLLDKESYLLIGHLMASGTK